MRKMKGSRSRWFEAPTANDTMKCLVTDTGCMKQAKAQRKKVELVEESELDTLRLFSVGRRMSQTRQGDGKESRHHRLNSYVHPDDLVTPLLDLAKSIVKTQILKLIDSKRLPRHVGRQDLTLFLLPGRKKGAARFPPCSQEPPR